MPVYQVSYTISCDLSRISISHLNCCFLKGVIVIIATPSKTPQKVRKSHKSHKNGDYTLASSLQTPKNGFHYVPFNDPCLKMFFCRLFTPQTVRQKHLSAKSQGTLSSKANAGAKDQVALLCAGGPFGRCG